jgi:hypothetical protein
LCRAVIGVPFPRGAALSGVFMSTVSLVVTAAVAPSLLGLAIWLGLALNRMSAEVGSRGSMKRMHFND